ncbi:translation initiation factor IF-2-like isoform X3 [Meles meles]|uniref:translation initiation factor IF-2-like isoform X3 n=1 Tax=Meles meles TaxID=9662 RepID=UPI001E69AD12|nr:translation initiation factor IF-2-like isoform X3 [Meles meles]
MDARGRRAGSRGPTEGTPGRRAASTSAPRVAPPPPAGLGRRSRRGKAGRGPRGEGGPGTAGRRRAGGPAGEKPVVQYRILDSPDAQPPEEDRIQGSQECAGTGLSVEVLPLLEPKPGPARPAALPQRMTPGPQLSGAGGRALAGRLQHEEPQQHPPAPRRPMLPGKHSASALDGRRPPAPQTGTQMGAILRNTEAEAARSLPRSRPGAQTSGDLRPFRLLCLPLLHVSTAPGSVRRHAFLLPEALPRLRTDYRLKSQCPPSPRHSWGRSPCTRQELPTCLRGRACGRARRGPPSSTHPAASLKASCTPPWTPPWTESAMKSWPLPPSKSGTKSKSEHWYNHCVGPASQQNVVAGRHWGGAGLGGARCNAR